MLYIVFLALDFSFLRPAWFFYRYLRFPPQAPAHGPLNVRDGFHARAAIR